MLKRRIVFIAFISLVFSSGAYAVADHYTFDKDHTHILFSISHIGFSKMMGRVKDYDGSFTFDPKAPQNSTLDVTLKSDSIDTDVPALNAELQTKKFLNTKQFPTMHFKSTAIHITGKNTGDITGDFTLLGVSRPVTLHVTYNKSGIHPYTNNYISGFSADAVIRRSDFGMNAYLPDVGDTIAVHIEAEGIDPLKHPGNTKIIQ